MILKKEFIVTDNHTAVNIGSGTLEVLATPSAIAMAENTCMTLCSSFLSETQTTVGIFIDFKHIKASLVGAEIRVIAKMEEKSEKKIIFSFEMFDKDYLIGKGKHDRVIVTTSSFLSHIK